MTKKNRYESFSNIVLAIYLNIQSLNVIITTLFPKTVGLAMKALYIIATMLLVLCMILRKDSIDYIGKSIFGITVLVSVYYVVSLVRHITLVSPVEFIVYTITPLLLLTKIKFDYKEVLQYCPIVTGWGILFSNMIFITKYNGISMGLSYAFLPPIVFSIVYLFTDRSKKISNIFAILNLFYLLQIILHGSRGTVLSAFVCVLYLVLIKRKGDKIIISSGKVIVFSVIGLILVASFWNMLESIYYFLKEMDIDALFIKKMLVLQESDDLNNGRTEIYEAAIRLIKQNPFWGYGISSFDYYTSLEYPHNFLIQFLFDIGIIGTVIVLGNVIKGIIDMFKRPDNDFEFISAIMCASIPGALFSGDLWKSVLLWLTFALLINRDCRSEIS